MTELIVTIRFVSCKTFHKMVTERKLPKHIRGWADPHTKEVFVCKEHFDGQLIGHEVLHTEAGGLKGHTIFPFLMNPNGIFRWFGNPIISVIKTIQHMRRKNVYNRENCSKINS